MAALEWDWLYEPDDGGSWVAEALGTVLEVQALAVGWRWAVGFYGPLQEDIEVARQGEAPDLSTAQAAAEAALSALQQEVREAGETLLQEYAALEALQRTAPAELWGLEP